MRAWRNLTICFLIFTSFTCAPGQTTPDAPPSYYANFVGRWIGSWQGLDDNDHTVTPVEITISLTRKNDRLRMDYIYGKKGDKDIDHSTRFLILNPVKEELISNWDDHGNDHYATSGLNAFAKSGHGSFIAAQKTFLNGKSRTDICVFTLEDDTFSYNWKMTLDGVTFHPISIFSLKRVATSAGSMPGH